MHDNLTVCFLSLGFGSMLRTIGAQIEKTTNRESMRDLSGRRMRDINNEKKLVSFFYASIFDESHLWYEMFHTNLV